MAPQQPHDRRLRTRCVCCNLHIRTQSQHGDYCHECYAVLFTVDSQMLPMPMPAGDQFPQPLQTHPAPRIQALQMQLQQNHQTRQTHHTHQSQQTQLQQNHQFVMGPANVNADWARLNAEVQMMQRELHAGHQQLRQREDEMRRRLQTMMMTMMMPPSQQQQQSPNAGMLHRPSPPNMRIANSGSHITSQPPARSGIDININPRMTSAKYDSVPRRTTPVNHAKRTHESAGAGHIISPMTRTDSFSPMRQRAIPPIGPHFVPPAQQGQQHSSSLAASGVSPQVVAPADTMRRPTGTSDGSALAQKHNSRDERMTRQAAHVRHDSSASSTDLSGMGSTSSNGSMNHTPLSTPPSVSDAWSNASPANKSTPAQDVSQIGHNAQLAALNAQLAHEQAVKRQRELASGIPITNLPQKVATGRLLCPDCKLDRPIVRKKNDGVFCTSCFTKRIKAGGSLQTLAQRDSAPQSPHVHKAAPTVRMSPNLSTAMHHLQRPGPVPSGHTSFSNAAPYELDLARRRVAEASPGSSPQFLHFHAQRADAAQQPTLIRRAFQASSYTPSPLANGQYQVPQTTTSASPLLFPSPPKAGSGTPKRGHEEAFATVGLEVHDTDAPTSQQLSPPQSNKKSKPSPPEHPAVLTSESRQSTVLTPDATPSKANDTSHGVNTANSTDLTPPSQLEGAPEWVPAWALNDMAPLSPTWIENELATMYAPAVDPNAPADHLQTSAGSSGDGRSLEDIEAELAFILAAANAAMDAEKAETEEWNARNNAIAGTTVA